MHAAVAVHDSRGVLHGVPFHALRATWLLKFVGGRWGLLLQTRGVAGGCNWIGFLATEGVWGCMIQLGRAHEVVGASILVDRASLSLVDTATDLPLFDQVNTDIRGDATCLLGLMLDRVDTLLATHLPGRGHFTLGLLLLLTRSDTWLLDINGWVGSVLLFLHRCHLGGHDLLLDQVGV